jgi:hypothetical protein
MLVIPPKPAISVNVGSRDEGLRRVATRQCSPLCSLETGQAASEWRCRWPRGLDLRRLRSAADDGLGEVD